MLRRAATLIAAVALALVPVATPALGSAGDEAAFVDLINQERAARGLPGLEVYWDLVDDARIHAGVMSDADQIFHSSNLADVTTGWSVLGENVGVGSTVADLHAAFMNSPGHRDNILGDWNYVGVGVADSDRGYMFVTVVFMKGADVLVGPPVEDAPAPAPKVLSAASPDPEPVAPPSVPSPAPGQQTAPIVRMIDHLLNGVPFPFAPV